jgi:transketolase
MTDPDMRCVNTIRGLCMDAIQRADSGHPGTPMDIAPVAYTLWQRFLMFDPIDPIWPNRDRFVLSEGHASALLWSLLHLAGVRAVDLDYEVLGRRAVTLDDLKTFRRLDSHCPGHPECRWTSGVEATTGPPGQYDVSTTEMATIGDMPNDVLMFAHSGLSIAMGNASIEVARTARRVTTTNDDDGFAGAVDRYILRTPT